MRDFVLYVLCTRSVVSAIYPFVVIDIVDIIGRSLSLSKYKWHTLLWIKRICFSRNCHLWCLEVPAVLSKISLPHVEQFSFNPRPTRRLPLFHPVGFNVVTSPRCPYGPAANGAQTEAVLRTAESHPRGPYSPHTRRFIPAERRRSSGLLMKYCIHRAVSWGTDGPPDGRRAPERRRRRCVVNNAVSWNQSHHSTTESGQKPHDYTAISPVHLSVVTIVEHVQNKMNWPTQYYELIIIQSRADSDMGRNFTALK